jgi:hypothetical protein
VQVDGSTCASDGVQVETFTKTGAVIAFSVINCTKETEE